MGFGFIITPQSLHGINSDKDPFIRIIQIERHMHNVDATRLMLQQYTQYCMKNGHWMTNSLICVQ